MKKLILISSLTIFVIITLQAQEFNKKSIDPKTKKEILLGKCNLEGLKTGDFGQVFKIEYKNYIADTTVISILRKKMKNINIEIILGTWCGDSKDQVPRFIKILNELKYNTRKLTIFSVNRGFKADGFDKNKSNIIKVPTFIIYRKNTEIGRIIETPLISLEKDLLEILNK